MFRESQIYDVRSRGVARGARVRLTAADIAWADAIFVMEKEHKDRMTENFGRDAARGKVTCLFIEDVYEAMEESLVRELRSRLAPHLALPDEQA
jgi:protein-tyrosine phosphatase